MARSILLTDEEEQWMREIAQANLKGLSIHDVIHGPCESSKVTRALIYGLMRKLEIEIVEEPTEFPIEPEISDKAPGSDLARMAEEVQRALAPTIKLYSADRIERIAGPLFVRVMSGLLLHAHPQDRVVEGAIVERMAVKSLNAAESFMRMADARRDV